MAKYHVWTRGQLADLSSRYDVALIGSDQIWNPYQVKWGGLEYGSAFRTEQRVSVSASFGLDAAPDEYREYMAEHLSGMRKISVREVAGKEIVRDLVGREAEVLIDPTLALSRDDWSSVASTEYLPEGRHVLVYALGKLSDVNAASVASAASRNGAETVRLLDRSASRYYPTGPQDFIGLIRSSELVVTDSFHAVVFSLLFERDVVLIERQGKSYSMLSRFSSLCRLLGLEMVADDEFENAYRFVGGGEASLTDNLDAQRLKFRKYLADLLQPRYAG
jgi:polysaccharide pyruvyl transferase WcaK-like protein